jgi:hypothetical protein
MHLPSPTRVVAGTRVTVGWQLTGNPSMSARISANGPSVRVDLTLPAGVVLQPALVEPRSSAPGGQHMVDRPNGTRGEYACGAPARNMLDEREFWTGTYSAVVGADTS